MPKIQVFIDYECPYCKLGYEDLMDIIPAYPDIKIEWVPIEAHPRPEDCRPHTDLCIQAYYIALELGADMDAFHRALYQGVAIEKRDVEKGEVLAEILKGLVDSGKFLESLKSGKYAPKVDENNNLAYKNNDVWYVPAFRASGVAPLDSRGGIGVSREEIKNFLNQVLNNK